jgi:hypothetical protein
MPPMKRLLPILCLIVATTAAAQQPAVVYSDKIADLAGTWVLDPMRTVGGICGVSIESELVLEASADAVTVRKGRFLGRFPFAESTGNIAQEMVAGMDAGWLALTTTTERSQGFANIMRDVFILNRDRTQLTVWRTLNVRRPDGAPDKIDCGNHVAMVYRRQRSD